MEMSTYISCTFVLGQAVSSIPGKAIYILDNDGNNETSGWGGAETEKTQARNSEKEHSQGWACLPWHVLLPFGNANTTLMNTSATREFSQHLFPFNQELFWRYFKRRNRIRWENAGLKLWKEKDKGWLGQKSLQLQHDFKKGSDSLLECLKPKYSAREVLKYFQNELALKFLPCSQ